MAEHTKIQWCDHTMNPWLGCTKVATGCLNCYAEMMMDTRYGKVAWGPRGTRVRTKTWNQPPRWNMQAQLAGERRKVFCASLADVFESFEGDADTDRKLGGLTYLGEDTLAPWRRDLFGLIDRCQNLDWLLLTKRPQNIRPMWVGPNRANVWLGTSISTQKDVEEYVPRLLSARGLGPILFLSVEPQIERIDLSRYLFPVPVVDWIICGGESKQGSAEARKFQIDWASTLVHQCREAKVPCFIKQMGSNVWWNSQRVNLRDSHGGDISEWPEYLRVRECPETFYPALEAFPV